MSLFRSEKKPDKNTTSAFSRQNNWYYKGWSVRVETMPNGKQRKEWVYNGSYYYLDPSEDALRLKVTVAVSVVLLTIIWLALNLAPSLASRYPYVAYICIFAAIPLLYLWMGAFWLIYTKGKMTYRRFHASVERVKTFCLIGFVLMAITGLSDLIFIVKNFSALNLLHEGLYFIGVLICVVQFATVWSTVNNAVWLDTSEQ